MKRRRITVLFAALALVLGAGRSMLPASQTLRVDTKLINIFATVKNERGEFVPDLSAADFRLYEDGVEQKIAVFERDDRVQSAVAILLDSSGSMVDIFPLMRRGTMEFVRLSPKSDDLAVLAFGITTQVLRDFGKPVSDLETRLNAVRARGTSVFFDALLDGIRRVSAREQTRKALIVFSDGNSNGSAAGFKEVEGAVARSGVLLYFVPIGPKVLVDQHTLESLAELSAGSVTYLGKTDPIPPAITAIRTELSRQYYLGYYAAGEAGPHSIRVEIPARPNLRIRAKSGYTG